MTNLSTKLFKETLNTLEDTLREAAPDMGTVEDCLDMLLKLTVQPAWHWGRNAGITLADIITIERLEATLSPMRAAVAMSLYCILMDELEPQRTTLELQEAFDLLANPEDAPLGDLVEAQEQIADAWEYEGLDADVTDEQFEVIMDFAGIRTERFTAVVHDLLPEMQEQEVTEDRYLVAA